VLLLSSRIDPSLRPYQRIAMTLNRMHATVTTSRCDYSLMYGSESRQPNNYQSLPYGEER